MKAAGQYVWVQVLASVLVLALGCAERSPDEVQNVRAGEGPQRDRPVLDGGAASSMSNPGPPAGGSVGPSEAPSGLLDASVGDSLVDPSNVLDAAAANADAAIRELPSTVTVEGVHSGTDHAATFAQGGLCFLGFRATAAALQLDFQAFVQEPGSYQGDPIHALYLSATTAEGRAFVVNTISATPGEIDLTVSSVSPRFVGHMTATLFDEQTPEAPPLELAITFDIGGVEACTG